ncbi:DUF2637 domain-containing protein [Streptomyces sp. PCS3-D2]|uniref:DUF2637 domain-containing protein n=1 Tax=Streptomyces sp. PCS3-D2 TaxID=1460244 RepID=UPI00044DBC06|nr:DUF2637 domain-containing protein [Streptomyces sp. PCS3-D2]WKV72542.1 DUF2637 domain-containing protein [Streptomyces sp. PCS3-D2]
MAAMQLTRTHRILIGVVVAGAVVIAGIGFAGSYAAVRELAEKKGFGSFSLVFPIGIDAGICVLLALDLLLTWLRIPFPLLRQTAWLLTAATIAFNGAASWPDPLGVGMHAVIPILFVVTVEAARHAVGRIADITADRHMEGVRITRWLLSPVPTFKLWRRMKLWELRSYEQAIGMEQDRLIYQARMQARYGRFWRQKAPVEALMPLKLARIGVPLSQTAPDALAATGIDPAVLPPPAQQTAGAAPALEAPLTGAPQPDGEVGPDQEAHRTEHAQLQQAQLHQAQIQHAPAAAAVHAQAQAQAQGPQVVPAAATQIPPAFAVDPTAMPAAHNSAWFAGPKAPQAAYEGGYNPQYVEGLEPTPVLPPMGPDEQQVQAAVPGPRAEADPAAEAGAEAGAEPGAEAEADGDAEKFAEAAYEVFRTHLVESGEVLTAEQLDILLADRYGVVHPRSGSLIRKIFPQLKLRYQRELENEHIA